MSWLAPPNVAADPANLRRNAEAVMEMLSKRGIKTRLLEHEGSPPVVYGELPVQGASRTLTFYVHYDGSPLNSKEWLKPPFEPVLRSAPIERDGQVIPLPPLRKAFDPEWRIYARSAGDDKAPVVALITALDALEANGQRPSANLKFVIEERKKQVQFISNRSLRTTKISSEVTFG